MKADLKVAFVQRRAHKAGAQTGLARLLGHPAIRRLAPVLITSETGWLTEEARRVGVEVICEPFPSSRSLPARLFLNDLFAGRVKRRLNAVGYKPDIVQANDHMEGLLAIKLAAVLGARSAMFLRSSWMTERDYRKYGCDRFDLVSAAGEALCRKAGAWSGVRNIRLIHDGLYESEFSPVKVKCPTFPARVLVLGSPDPNKGWADFTEALRLLEEKMSLPLTDVDFTGVAPDPARNELKTGRTALHFPGRVEDFKNLVLQYDLVVNPSRGESFGLAALEVLAAGVPLLSSRTGIIEQVLKADHMLFVPHDPRDLSMKLEKLMTNWGGLDFGVLEAQNAIRRQFGIDRSVAKLLEGYGELFRA